MLAGTATASVRGEVLDHAASCEECMAALSVMVTAGEEPAAPVLPVRVDRYELGRELGRGGMGVVYTARDVELEREVAIKILRPHASAARLRREAQALAKLSHPNVVRIYDVGEHDGHVFLAMELVDGDTLRTWLRTPRTPAQIVDVMLHAASGLIAAHRAGLVHRDFKPDNVFVRSDGQVLVGDFGLARSVGPAPSEDGAPVPVTALETSDVTLTKTGAFVGTPAYMAPEQISGGDVTSAADQFAFCVTAWEALYGERPFAGDTIAQIRDAIRAGKIQEPQRDAPARVEAALRRGLAADSQARFPSLAALVDAIAPRKKRKWPWIAFVAVIAATGTATAFTLSQRAAGINCAVVGDQISSVWTPQLEAKVRDRDSDLAAGIGRYAKSWKDQRVDACRATHERHDQTEDVLDRRNACLDRARDLLRITVDAVVDKEVVPRTTHALEGLIALERCKTGIVPLAPAVAFATSSIELEIAVLNLRVRNGSGLTGDTFKRVSELREQAKAVGYGPTLLALDLLEARIAAWRGDDALAEQTLRSTIVEAEAQHDDFTRARAMAALALRLVDTKLEEATYFATGARAALTRAGEDSSVEVQVLEAEVVIERERKNFERAIELQNKLIAIYTDRYSSAVLVVNGYLDLGKVYLQAGRYDEAGRAHAKAMELMKQEYASAPELSQFAVQDSTPLLIAGDFDGALLMEEQQLAALRSSPEFPVFVEAQTLTNLATTEEIAGNHANAAARYREARALWKRIAGEPPDPNLAAPPGEVPAQEIGALAGEAYNLLELRRLDEAIAVAREALALAPAGVPRIAEELPPLRRVLARALVAKGNYREARKLLETLDPTSEKMPFSRGTLRFALARCLWEDGGIHDRERANVLAMDAAADIEQALRENSTVPAMRMGLQRIRAEEAAVAAWRKTHVIH